MRRLLWSKKKKWFSGSMADELDLVEEDCDQLLYTEGP